MHRTLCLVAVLLLTASPSSAGEQVDYLKQIKPLLSARCYPCHGALKQQAGLRLDTAAAIQQGGKQGPAIVPGKSDQSLLLERVSTVDDTSRMPPESEGEGLKAPEIALLKEWIDQGAASPPDEKPEPDPREHWAFRAPVRPSPPFSGESKTSAQPRNPIDGFLLAKLRTAGLEPVAEADKRLLLRRVHLDLIGLPPTREEQAAFLADQSPDAFERIVDRLLASPQYGERWGRHWMDIWRYSDWWGLGAEVRNSQKHIWHWRDWIIESLNADKGYDLMIREMLAADELYPTDYDKLRATGFLARQYFRFNRNTWLDETVEHTSKAFLGLTINCAKCHDHKFDPIAQMDYYRLRAFFEPYQVRIDQLPGEVDLEKNGLPRAFDCNLDSKTFPFQRGDEKRPLLDRPLSPGLPALLTLGDLTIHPVALPPEAQHPGLRPFVLADQLRAAQDRIRAARSNSGQAMNALGTAEAMAPRELNAMLLLDQASKAVVLAEKTLQTAEAQVPALLARAQADQVRAYGTATEESQALTRAAAVAERQAAVAKAEEELANSELAWSKAEPAKQAEITKRLSAARTGLAQARKALETPGESYLPLQGSAKTPESNLEAEASRNKPYPITSSGRRSALAQWLTDQRNPLTARVAVNHIWLRHFGRPLVTTVFDFGRKGSPPTHPELLDYLAVEFMENGWSIKHLHRLMVTSSAYRRASSSAGADSARQIDPENRLYWRMNPVRMEAQLVRDSLLHLAGELNPMLGGPSVPSASQEQSRRRSLYFFQSHNEHDKFLSMFDDANVLECYRRAESIVPQQALALSNSKLAQALVEKIAHRLNDKFGQTTDEEFIRAAFELLLASEPTAAELLECKQAFEQWGDGKRARRLLVGVLVNHNDYVTIR